MEIDRNGWNGKLLTPEQAAGYVTDGMTIALGGYTQSGYPQGFLHALDERIKEGKLHHLQLVGGSALGEADTILAPVLDRVYPLVESKALSARINQGNCCYVEQQISRGERLLRSGKIGKIDLAVVEGLTVDGEGRFVPSSCVGLLDVILELADHVIIEINRAQPVQLGDMIDIFSLGIPPNRKPIPATRLNEKIGNPWFMVDPEKILGVVDTDCPASEVTVRMPSESMCQIADYLIGFLQKEYAGRPLPPLQTGFGVLAQCIADALTKESFYNLQFFCGALLEPHMELLASGKASAATATSIQMTKRTAEILKTHPELKEKIVLRNLLMINQAEMLGRFGVIAVNTGIEADIYGNVNASHIGGTRVVNGLGGGAHFAQNAALSVIALPSLAKNGEISGLVPMVPHVDITEHDVDILITEQGIADIRGLDDRERAECIIRNCAHPLYREKLLDYFVMACEQTGGHHPQLMSEAAKWHDQLRRQGTMR